MGSVRVLAFAGSSRVESFNRKLIREAAKLCEEGGAEVTLVDLKDFDMPIYNGDLEQASGLPPKARELKELFKRHNALLIASPEYNSSITPLLKNTLDWVSRREGDEPPLAAYRGKVCALLSASPGALGGLRALSHLRSILMNINVMVIPQQYALSNAAAAFSDSGQLTDATQSQKVQSVTAELVKVASALQVTSEQ